MRRWGIFSLSIKIVFNKEKRFILVSNIMCLDGFGNGYAAVAIKNDVFWGFCIVFESVQK